MPERAGPPVVVTVHYLVRDDAVGTVQPQPVRMLGKEGLRRYRVACGTKQTATDRLTTMPFAVACAACKLTPEWLAAYKGPPKPGGPRRDTRGVHGRLAGSK